MIVQAPVEPELPEEDEVPVEPVVVEDDVLTEPVDPVLVLLAVPDDVPDELEPEEVADEDALSVPEEALVPEAELVAVVLPAPVVEVPDEEPSPCALVPELPIPPVEELQAVSASTAKPTLMEWRITISPDGCVVELT